MKLHSVLLALLVLRALAASAEAMKPDVWISSDMGGGGWMNQVKAGPSGIILANTDLSGTYLSRDRGKSWTCIGAAQGLRETHACGLGFDSTNSKVLFIGTEGGIYRSEDAGQSFTKVLSGIYCTDIQISRTSPRIGYAAGISRHNRSDGKVYKTVDNGRTWAMASIDLPDQCIIEDLVIDPKDPNVVWGHAYPGRFAKSINTLFKSINGGVNWTEVNPLLFRDRIFDFAVDPSNPRGIYVAGPGIGLVKSTDGGVTWSEKKTSFEGSIFIKADKPNVVRILGAWSWQESQDYGETWAQKPYWPESSFLPGHNWGGALNTRKNDDLSNSDTYFWRNSCWVWASFDGAKTIHPLWTDELPPGSGRFTNRGLKNTNLWTVATSEADPDAIYAGFWDMGLWRSLDRGQTWESCNNTDLTGEWKTRVDNQTKQGCGGNTVSIACDPARPNVLWATLGGDQFKPQTLYKSTSKGQYDRWVKSHEGLPETWDILGLSVDRNSPSDRRTLFVTAKGDVYRGTDDGARWTRVSTGLRVSSTCPDALCRGRVYAGGAGGLFRSTDNGSTWEKIGLSEMTGISDIRIDPSNKDWVYAACNGDGNPKGLYRSRDAGATWQRILEDCHLRTVAIDPTNPMNLYAGSSSARDAGGYRSTSQGVLVSRDGGTTWRQANEGLSWPFVNRLEVNPKDPSFVIAAAPGLGVQRRRFTPATRAAPVKNATERK